MPDVRPDFAIRPAIAADLPRVLSLVHELAEYEGLTHLVTATEDTLRDALFGTQPSAEAVLAFEGQEPVGIAIYYQSFSTFLGRRGLWLEDLYIRPHFRRRGYGEAVRLLATDLSADALGLAVENAVGHGVADAIEFRRADLLDGVGVGGAGMVDLVLANLPYVPSGELPGLPVAASFEPAMALDGGPDGSRFITRLVERLDPVLTPEGSAFLEFGDGQAEGLREVLEKQMWIVEAIEEDYTHRPRIMVARQANKAEAKTAQGGAAS